MNHLTTKRMQGMESWTSAFSAMKRLEHSLYSEQRATFKLLSILDNGTIQKLWNYAHGFYDPAIQAYAVYYFGGDREPDLKKIRDVLSMIGDQSISRQAIAFRFALPRAEGKGIREEYDQAESQVSDAYYRMQEADTEFYEARHHLRVVEAAIRISTGGALPKNRDLVHEGLAYAAKYCESPGRGSDIRVLIAEWCDLAARLIAFGTKDELILPWILGGDVEAELTRREGTEWISAATLRRVRGLWGSV